MKTNLFIPIINTKLNENTNNSIKKLKKVINIFSHEYIFLAISNIKNYMSYKLGAETDDYD